MPIIRRDKDILNDYQDCDFCPYVYSYRVVNPDNQHFILLCEVCKEQLMKILLKDFLEIG